MRLELGRRNIFIENFYHFAAARKTWISFVGVSPERQSGGRMHLLLLSYNSTCVESSSFLVQNGGSGQTGQSRKQFDLCHELGFAGNCKRNPNNSSSLYIHSNNSISHFAQNPQAARQLHMKCILSHATDTAKPTRPVTTSTVGFPEKQLRSSLVLYP